MSDLGLTSGLGILLIVAMGGLYFVLRMMKRLLMIVLPVIAVLGVLAYQHWGSRDAIDAFKRQQVKAAQVNQLLKTIRSPNELIDKLKRQLAAKPQSVKGWYLLGRLYANQGDWAQAKSAYQQALTIKPNDVQANVNYIQALWESNQRQFNPDIIQRLHQLLQQSPQQPDALAMLAMDAYQTKQYDKAIEYWQQLLKLVPAESEEAQALRQAIARASSTR